MTAGLPGQFGALITTGLAAVSGFKSFTRGGFHKHDWKLLNDPIWVEYDIGAMVPLANVTDARSGAKAPALQMNYKGSNG